MPNVPYPAPHLGLWLALMGIMVFLVYLWYRAWVETPMAQSAPDTYTDLLVRRGAVYHVEQDGQTQDFEVLETHWSSYFLIQLRPPEGHELDRDYPVVTGWTRVLPSNRLIEAEQLLPELPVELRFRCN